MHLALSMCHWLFGNRWESQGDCESVLTCPYAPTNRQIPEDEGALCVAPVQGLIDLFLFFRLEGKAFPLWRSSIAING